MPLDDLSLDLTPPQASGETGHGLDVMTRILRLPTPSRRQARRIVQMQLDRLSPVPVRDTVFDLVPLGTEGAETLYALGIVRRAALSGTGRRFVNLSRVVEGQPVTFRFRDPDAVDDREARWLAHAPKAAVVLLGLAAVALASNLRADQWREDRLAEIARERRTAAVEARAAREEVEAGAEWSGLSKADAATRLLCISRRLRSAGGAQPIASLSADPREVRIVLPEGGDADAAARAGAAVTPGGPGGTEAVFGSELCR